MRTAGLCVQRLAGERGRKGFSAMLTWRSCMNVIPVVSMVREMEMSAVFMKNL